jgi:hypothetical protein
MAMHDDERTAGYHNLYRKLLAFYPAPFRERFGEGMEQTFHDLLHERMRADENLFGFVLWTLVDTAVGIIREHIEEYNIMKVSLIKQASAWLPMALSAVALALLLGYVAVFGIQEPGPGADESVAARIFQLLIVAQVPIIGFFALKWVPQAPKQALLILALQIAIALVPILTIFYLERGLY